MKKTIMFLIVCVLVLSIGCFAYSEKELDSAKTLYDLGLFKGSGDSFSAQSMDLDSTATRVQIAITVTRMLGKEQKAIYQSNSHPFSDVPDWASAHVGYLYESYLVNGTSDTTFGSNDAASVQQFSTMLLRVLGYSDENGEDFTYAGAKDFALEKGLIDNEIYSKTILRRGDMVTMCRNALDKPIKNSYRTLGVKLLNERVFTAEEAKKAGLYIPNMLERAYSNIPLNLPSFSVEKVSDNTVTLHLDDYVEHYGIRVFIIDNDEDVMKEVPYGKALGYQMTKGSIQYLGGGGAGYVDSITLTVPDVNSVRAILVLKTSSESQIYRISGRSPVVRV